MRLSLNETMNPLMTTQRRAIGGARQTRGTAKQCPVSKLDMFLVSSVTDCVFTEA